MTLLQSASHIRTLCIPLAFHGKYVTKDGFLLLKIYYAETTFFCLRDLDCACIPQPQPFPACSIFYKYFKICPLHIQIIPAHTRWASQIYIYMYYAHCAAGVADNYRILNFKFRISTGGQVIVDNPFLVPTF